MEVIRNCPGSPEPYQLLKAIVEDNGYATHAHKLGLFIASIDPHTTASQWLELAEESKQLAEKSPPLLNDSIGIKDHYFIAISCYRNAYKSSGDGNIKMQMGNLYLETRQWTLALQSYKQALKDLPPARFDQFRLTTHQ